MTPGRKGSAASAVALMVVGAAASVLPAAIGQTAEGLSVLTGAYSEEQAIQGQTLYNTYCFGCHGETMAGLDQAPPLAGPQFGGTWNGEPLAALVERIGAMPPDRPAGLTRQQNVDILTYILWYNGLPIGETPLSTEPSVLSTTTFQTLPLPGQ
jgi:mono/diheme cytochrome c family protein